MKRLFKGLIMPAVLCLAAMLSPHAHADITFDTSVEIVSPTDGATYTCKPPAKASVTVTSQDHWVAIYGGTANQSLSNVTWDLHIGTDTRGYLVRDEAFGQTITLNASGNWIHSASGSGSSMSSTLSVDVGQHQASGYAGVGINGGNYEAALSDVDFSVNGAP